MLEPAAAPSVVTLPFQPDLRLSRQLLNLHRSLTLEEFWRSLQSIVGSSLPSHSVSVYLNYFNIGRDFRALHHQSAPGTHRPWEERRKVSPTPGFLLSHVGRKTFDLAALMPDRRALPRSDYFKKVMAVEGWSSLYCLTYWQQANPQAMVVVRRTPQHGDFRPGEIELLESLYEHVETALARIQRSHDQKAGVACLTQCLPYYPLGLLVLNSRQEVIFKNKEALDACLVWNHGLGARRKFDAAKSFAIPALVSEACRELTHRWASRDVAADEEHLLRPIFVTHPTLTQWKISVSLVRPKDCCLAQPFFLVQCTNQQRDTLSSLEMSPIGVMRLQELTPSERLVAVAAAEGLSNAEIAVKLNKTFVTVRAQLHAVFAKLGIKRRSQLVVLLK